LQSAILNTSASGASGKVLKSSPQAFAPPARVPDYSTPTDLKRLPSIRSSLAKLVAACLLPALIVACILLYYSYQRARAELEGNALSQAQALMLKIDREFEGADRSLRALATSPYLAYVDMAAFHDQAQDVIKGNYINNIVLIDATGRQVVNTAVASGQTLPMGSNLKQLERVIKLGESDVSDLFMAPLPNVLSVNVAIPVRSGGEVTHSLVAVVLPKHLQKMLVESDLPPDRIVVIFDGYGAIAARTRDIDRFLGKSISPSLLQHLKSKIQGMVETVTLDGTPVLTVFIRSQTSHWGVAIGIPIASLTADLRHWLALLAGSTALLLVASLGTAWVMGGRIASAIRSLAEPAEALGYGQVVSVPELPISEVNDVAKSILKASTVLVESGHALAASEARLRGILESAPDAIIAIDENLIIQLINPAASRMFGWPVEQAIGMPATQLMPERFRLPDAGVQAAGQGNTQGLLAVAAMSFGLHRGGAEFPVEVSHSSGSASGAAWHTLVIRDITSRMRDYEALERSNLDLQQFAYVASHDLKTPLRSIGGLMQILERNYSTKLDEKGVALIHRAVAAVKRLELLTEDLLSYARLNSEVRPFVLVNCNDMAQEVIYLLDAPIAESGATVTAGDLPEVMGDRTQLVQLLLNLIGNGIKYCRDRAPVVHVSAHRGEREWVFSVADNGIGIDSQHHDKVFEVFKRLHTQTEYSGTGIGLSVCRRVVDRHGGKIWITSVVGEGTTFRFTIPDTPSESSRL
jgi:PAS domain S-box-containing protein